jgi:putative CocE/NonD family hydrolase
MRPAPSLARRHRLGLLGLALLLLSPLSGCLDPQDGEASTDLDPAAPLAYAKVKAENLSQPTFAALPPVPVRIAASIDGISLFAEVYLPDGPGPWPTILHSTPYKHLDKPLSLVGGNGLVDFYVPRGYAVVLADVRGFGDSEGCVEVWGANEQQDQYDLVEWVAAQPWSDGKVGMQGVSYPGTTPIEAAVMAPPHLTTIVAVAGLTDPYFDWHYDGVPTGEAGPAGSPAAYQAIGSAPPIDPRADPVAWMVTAANTGCGLSELYLAAYQMDSVYNEFYLERNLASRVKAINASVLYSQGFLDGNVKPTQMLAFFNEIDAPKKGFFGPWGHQNPARSDFEDYELAWFDHWLKGKDTGAMDGPTVEVVTNQDTWRADTAFPTAQATSLRLHLDPERSALSFEVPAEGSASWIADRRPRVVGGPAVQVEDTVRGHSEAEEQLVLTSGKLATDLYLSGVLHLDLNATMDSTNAYLMATLWEIGEDGERTRVTFGGLAAALREGMTEYKPVPAGVPVAYHLRFQPTEHIIKAGHALELELYTEDLQGATTDEALEPTTITVHGGPTGSSLDLPVLAGRPDAPLPWEKTAPG